MISAKVTKKWNIGALWPTDVAKSPPIVAKDGQLPNLTMDEIDGEIKLIRAERHKK